MEYQEIIASTSILVDAGLVVLIWMVQLIVYPSFKYYKSENLIEWHQKYTKGIAIIVIPLMLTQLALVLFSVIYQPNFETIVSTLMVVFLWIFTFLGFAPLHFKISEGTHNDQLLHLLVRRNWIRTFLWSALFIFHLLMYPLY